MATLPDTTPALAIRSLEKTYDGGQHALKGINLTVEHGDFFALLGPNGAGKSTLIGIISTLVRKTGGTVEVYGQDLHAQPHSTKPLLGVVPQEFNFNNFETPLQIVTQQAGYYGVGYREAKQRAEKLLKRLDLWEKRNDASRLLSGGMRRRLMIARALVHNPKLLILDEPTAGVDIELRRSLWEFLREINEAGTTIILTTHYLEEAEQLCRNIAIIDSGDIVTNTDMRSLLSQLDVETYVLNTQGDLATADLSALETRKTGDDELELDLRKGDSLSAALASLQASGIEVMNLRNKANRLEELFVRLTRRDQKEAAQ